MMSARQILLNALGNKCEKCGSTEKLQLHHKDGNRKNNDVRNIQLLCWECHKKAHGWGKERGVLYAEIEEGLEKRFRKKVIDIYGASKGALKRAVEEAIETWLEKKT